MLDGAVEGQTFNQCMTKAGTDWMIEMNGQPFRMYDYYKYVMANGDLPIFDRSIKQSTSGSEVNIKDADDFFDYVEVFDPATKVIRDGEVEVFGHIIDNPFFLRRNYEAEPIGFSPGFGQPAKGNGYMGDPCQRNVPDKGCALDTGIKCGI